MLKDSGCEGTFVNEDFTGNKNVLYTATAGESVRRLQRILN